MVTEWYTECDTCEASIQWPVYICRRCHLQKPSEGFCLACRLYTSTDVFCGECGHEQLRDWREVIDRVLAWRRTRGEQSPTWPPVASTTELEWYHSIYG